MKTRGPVNAPPISDITRSNLGTDSATSIDKIANILLIMHLLRLKSEKNNYNS